jgi:signal transduction histidine kinase
MKLSEFIKANIKDILKEWDSFARTMEPAAEDMTDHALRDHAEQILTAVAKDIESSQSHSQQYWKSRGMAPGLLSNESAAAIHGALRQADGFTLLQLTAEFRALRACVLRLWIAQIGQVQPGSLNDMLRFNEAIDQALAESVEKYSIQVNRTRDMFLAILGHDLRAPLASISLSGELLGISGISAEKVTSIGEQVERSAATMSSMVTDLLDFSRTQLGSKIPIKTIQIDLTDICYRAIDDVSAMYPKSKFNLTKEGNLAAQLDGARLHQVFCNLLINAAHYGAKEHPIEITAKAEGNALSVTVTNRGTTVPPESLKAIFNPLVQLSSEHPIESRPNTSLGLGLFIAREISEAHGGSIEVTSTENDGTTFKVTLPKNAAPS